MPKQNKQNIIAIAKIGKTFGVKGHLNIYPYDNSEILKKLEQVHIINNDQYTLRLIEEIRPHKKSTYVCKFKGINTPEEAKKLTHTEIGIEESELPALPEGEFYRFELLGLNVFNLKNQNLGTIESIIETGANDVLNIKGAKEHLVPYNDKTVKDVNLNQKTIIVDWDSDND